MPLRYLIFMLGGVIAAAATSIWVAFSLADVFAMDDRAWLIVVPVVLAAYGVWRVIEFRLRNNKAETKSHQK